MRFFLSLLITACVGAILLYTVLAPSINVITRIFQEVK